MLLHLVSLENEDPKNTYQTIHEELKEFDEELLQKEEWVILTKKDLVEQAYIEEAKQSLEKTGNRVFVLSANDEKSIKEFRDSLVSHIRDTYNGERD